MTAALDAETSARVHEWLDGDYDEETKGEIRRLMEEDPGALADAFYTNLSFGTGGLRGVMGVGTNRMNRYTVRAATQGLAAYVLQVFGKGPHRVVIGYDSRRNSRFFASEAARVLAGNGIEAVVFQELRPTPMVSFACRHLGCKAAIMLTASHNPPEYNGYKVYWQDGAQVLPPHDVGIIEEVGRVEKVRVAHEDDSFIRWMGDDLDSVYVETMRKLQIYPEENARHGTELKVVYTNLHGTGITLVPAVMASWGFTNFLSVREQHDPDGSFPTTKYPNPEERSALALGIKTLERERGDILMATDPDADRVGIAIWEGGKERLFTGNEVACLCLWHVCGGNLPEQAAFVKTIVTTELFRAIAEGRGKRCVDVLPGFKYVAEKIREWEGGGPHFVFGGEESYGYLLGTYVRDKDGVSMCALIAEMALKAKREGKTLEDLLHDIYQAHGVYREGLESVKFPETRQGREAMTMAMKRLREAPPREIGGHRVLMMEDYLKGVKVDRKTGEETPLTFPKSDILLFWLDLESKVVIRPSGTEPKVKIYAGVKGVCGDDVKESVIACQKRLEMAMRAAMNLLSN